jgi:CBS domain-containing protein
MSIEALLAGPVQALRPHDTCAEAARQMRDANIGAIVVQDGGRPVGVVTDRDVAVRVVAGGLDAERTPLADVMSDDPVFLSHERSLGELIAAMRDLAIRRIVVVDSQGRLEGLVSMDDLVMLLADQLGALAGAIRAELGMLGDEREKPQELDVEYAALWGVQQ